jgi:Protein of unknown function (DUF3606)
MADSGDKKAFHARTRINLSQHDEVYYWTRRLGVSEGALEQAVKVVGSDADAVEQFFKDHPAAR